MLYFVVLFWWSNFRKAIHSLKFRHFACHPIVSSQCYQQLIFVGFLAANEFMDFFDYYSPISNFAGFRDVPRFYERTAIFCSAFPENTHVVGYNLNTSYVDTIIRLCFPCPYRQQLTLIRDKYHYVCIVNLNARDYSASALWLAN